MKTELDGLGKLILLAVVNLANLLHADHARGVVIY